MRTVELNLDDRIYEKIKEKAKADQISVEDEAAGIIQKNFESKKSFFELAKDRKWISKGTDVSENHDKYLYGMESAH